MNLYKLTRTDEVGYDQYDSCVVCANTEEEALQIHPRCLHTRLQYVVLNDLVEELTEEAINMFDEEERKTPGWFQITTYSNNDATAWVMGDWEWAPPDTLRVELIGRAVSGMKPGVVLASYNAG